jgi:hypothetical protein
MPLGKQLEKDTVIGGPGKKCERCGSTDDVNLVYGAIHLCWDCKQEDFYQKYRSANSGM